MGRPAHYSLDIVARSRSLLEHLLPIVAKGLPDDKQFDGPLTTTFLLSMAIPIISLPVERIFKPGKPDQKNDFVADDTALHAGLTQEVQRVFDDKTPFKFFAGASDWRLIRAVQPFNIAQWEGGQHFEALSGEFARKAAHEASARFMLIHLRNALAHGGIVYLDADGRQNDRRADMLAFVSIASFDRKTQKITGLHVSRVGEADFLRFLQAWSDWIAKSGIRDALSAKPPLAA